MSDEALHAKLKAVREKGDLTLPHPTYLQEKILKLDGTEIPLRLRPYQLQMVVHLMVMTRFIVGDDTGLGKCQPYDSLVLTDEGLLRMGEIEDWSSMASGSFRPMGRPLHVLVGGERLPVKSFYYGGVKPTITVTTRYGFRNAGSRVHPMLVLRGGHHQWVKAQDIQEGDYLCVERRQSAFPETEPVLPPGPTGMTPDFARFLGYYIGEGGLTSRYQVRVSQSPRVNPEVHADILRLFETCFGVCPPHPEKKDLYLSHVGIRRWLEAIGCGYTRSSERYVPQCILQASRASSREFLRALFEGEGHVSTSHIEFSTASEELGRQVQIMLLRFGVVARRAVKHVKAYPGNTYWRLTICGASAARFQEELGFISTRKQKALAACLNRQRNTNHDVVPEIQWVFDQVRTVLLAATSKGGANADRLGSGLKQLGVSFVNTLNNIRNYGRNPSYEFIRTTRDILLAHAPESEVLPLLEGFLDTGYFYDPVVELEEGEEEVFDIEVDDPRHCFVSNGLMNHNTVETIAALCQLWHKNPSQKVLILTKKSSVPQWESEFERFTQGVQVFVATGSPGQRKKMHKAWEEASGGPAVLIQGYTSLGNDLSDIQHWKDFILVLDECTVFKTTTTRVHKVCRYLSSKATRVWGLTATLIKNNLMEGYGVYRVVVPDLFKMTPNAFMTNFCIVQMERVRNNRRVPKIVGYHEKDITRFREMIDLYYLGRPKHAVAKDLPLLTTRNVRVGLTDFQAAKYNEALTGLLAHGDGELRDYADTVQMTKLIYCQEIVNHPGLIEFHDYTSEKLDALVDMLTDGGDLEGEKVIVFTRFKKMVDIAIPVLEKCGVRCTRVTGDEDEKQRKTAMDAFQSPKSETKVIFITMAGGDAINLQAAKAIVFYDTPWSAGDYIQVLGRMIRIGSEHEAVYAIHLMARGTIDEHVLSVVRKKMNLIEKVLGERVKGQTGEDVYYDAGSETKDLLQLMIADARARP